MPNVGRTMSDKKKHAQSVLFNEEKWTRDSSEKWCDEHGYKTDGFDKPDGSTYLHWRQYDPDSEQFDYRNVDIGNGIMICWGIPKGQAKGRSISEFERRSFPLAECRVMTVEDGSGPSAGTVEGRAAVYGYLSEPIFGLFREKFGKRAFRKSVQEADVIATVGHDPTMICGRVRSKTLTIEDREDGVHYRDVLPDTTYARDLASVMRRGDVSQCSFTFRELRQRWDKPGEDGLPVRVIEEAAMSEICFTPTPYYPDTTAALRSMAACRDAGAREAMPRWIEALAEFLEDLRGSTDEPEPGAPPRSEDRSQAPSEFGHVRERLLYLDALERSTRR